MSSLWAMHILGPDDIWPAPSKEEALEVANSINIEFKDFEVRLMAVVVPWDGSDEFHANHLETWKENWRKAVEASH